MDIQTKLNYSVREFNRPYFYSGEKEETPENSYQPGFYGGENKLVDVEIKDGRGLGLTLDENSFELVDMKTAMKTQDFYENPEKITKVYYEEVKELLKKNTGASFVHIFHHQVRNRDRFDGEGTDIQSPVQGYAENIHSDISAYSSEILFKDLLNANAELLDCSKGRFVYVNVWRNISDIPIENHHLAVCDERSLVKPDDYIVAEFKCATSGYNHLQHYLNERNSHLHKWYYFSIMNKNEAIIFKQSDSDTTQHSRQCFHSAFTDPNAPDDCSVRQSIEVRAMIFFPEHTPNTCPILEESDTSKALSELSEEEVINTGVKKVLEVISDLKIWPSIAIGWLRGEVAKGRKGVENIALTLATDGNGHLGLKSLPKETKQKIASAVMDSNFENILRQNLSKVKQGQMFNGKKVSISKATAIGVLCFAVGWGLALYLGCKKVALLK